MIEANKIYNECCLKTLQRMPNKSVQLVITSPPYNMRTRIRNGKYTTREKAEHFSKKYKHFADDLPPEEFYLFHSKVLAELIRVSKIVCYNFQIVTGSKEAFFRIIGEFSRDIKDVIIWDKGHGEPAMHDNILNSCYEIILILEGDNRGGRAIQNANFKRGGMNNILRIGRSKNKVSGHGAIFPEKLAAELMRAFSIEGDLIYDPFIGTGTTGIVSEKLNRNWIGSEISEQYYKIAVQRISQTNGLFK